VAIHWTLCHPMPPRVSRQWHVWSLSRPAHYALWYGLRTAPAACTTLQRAHATKPPQKKSKQKAPSARNSAIIIPTSIAGIVSPLLPSFYPSLTRAATRPSHRAHQTGRQGILPRGRHRRILPDSCFCDMASRRPNFHLKGSAQAIQAYACRLASAER
jgi:hypothetical protein